MDADHIPVRVLKRSNILLACKKPSVMECIAAQAQPPIFCPTEEIDMTYENLRQHVT